MEEIFIKSISKKNIENLLDMFSELGLREHYSFSDDVTSTIDCVEDVTKLLEGSFPIKFTFSDDNTLYYTLEGQEQPVVFDEDILNSFSKSDQWLYNKLVKISSIFPNACTADVSVEQTGFYVCLIIASIFQDEFLVEFREVADNFDFKNWSPNSENGLSFSETSTSWIQLGSKSIKMVAAAAKYALVREKVKKQAPSALQLPEDTVLRLNETVNAVAQIRWNYDNVRLSPEARKLLTKLDIQLIIRKRDEEVSQRLKEDAKIYQIWRLMNLNSNVIPPTIILKFNRKCRSKSIELFKLYNDTVNAPISVEEKLITKKIDNKLKKELRRAYLNKILADQITKYHENPDGYIAPDFV
jgi:hypothetical protein